MNRLLALISLSALLIAAPGSATPLPEVGKQVPWIAAFDLNGSPVNIGKVLARKGARGAVVAFWATWCKACLHELEQLRDARDQLKAAGVEVLLVNVMEDQEKVAAKLGELNMGGMFSTVRDATGSIAESMGINQPSGGDPLKLPFAMVVARRNQMVVRVATSGSQTFVEDVLADLQGEPDLSAAR